MSPSVAVLLPFTVTVIVGRGRVCWLTVVLYDPTRSPLRAATLNMYIVLGLSLVTVEEVPVTICGLPKDAVPYSILYPVSGPLRSTQLNSSHVSVMLLKVAPVLLKFWTMLGATGVSINSVLRG